MSELPLCRRLFQTSCFRFVCDLVLGSWCFHSIYLLLLAIFTSSVIADEPMEVFNTEPDPRQLSTPEESLASLKLPDGFQATLFAHEPDVQNPISMTFEVNTSPF